MTKDEAFRKAAPLIARLVLERRERLERERKADEVKAS